MKFKTASKLQRWGVFFFIGWVGAAFGGDAPALPQRNLSSKPKPYTHAPDLANMAYGPHERNVMDVWKAKSDKPTPIVVNFHGGGFNHGDKSMISPLLVEYCLGKGLTVATVNYRLSTQAIYPAQLEDSARAVQFIRYHAKEWNVNPKALAVTGGSAGGVISMWLGFREDMADPASADPVKHESTRPTVTGPIDGQSSLDMREIVKMLGETWTREAGTYPASFLFGLQAGEDLLTAKRLFPVYEEASPINHLKAGAVPTYMYYANPPGPIPPRNHDDALHNFHFGMLVKERMDKLGLECELHHSGEYGGKGGLPALRDMVTFFEKHFPKETK